MTQEQQWGLEYLLQLHNEGIAARNATLADRNRMIPRDQPLLEPEKELTVQEYIDLEVSRMGDRGYQQLVARKVELTREAFAQASPEQQTELLTMLGVPDILKG